MMGRLARLGAVLLLCAPIFGTETAAAEPEQIVSPELRRRFNEHLEHARKFPTGHSNFKLIIRTHSGYRGILGLGLPVVPLLIEHCDESFILPDIALELLGDEIRIDHPTGSDAKAAALKKWWVEIGSKDPRFRSYVSPAAPSAGVNWPLALGSGFGGLLLGFLLAALIFRRRPPPHPSPPPRRFV